MYGAFEIRTRPEFLDELEGRAHRVEGRNLKNPRVAKIDDALILIFLQQRFKHGAGLRAVFGENIPLADIFRALAPRERRLVESHMADEVEGIEVLADLLGQRVEGQAFVFEFFNDGLLALGRFPALEKIIEAGKAFLQSLLGEVPQGFGDELAVLVEIFDALGDDGGPYPIDIDFARRFFARLDSDVGRLPSTITSSSPGSGGIGSSPSSAGGTSSGGVMGSFSPGS